MIAETLDRLGYEVTTAMSGTEALKKVEESSDRFDLVITDEVMPELTGMKLAEKILRVRKDLPIILMSGYSETASSEKSKTVGIREFVVKPVDKRELSETVRRVLDGRNKGPGER